MLANIRIVLVRPRGSGNIGSIARAMKNMGQTELAIVGTSKNPEFLGKSDGCPRQRCAREREML